jgi:hypothetical protein
MSKDEYTLDYVLEMMNGLDNGFSYNQVLFIFHSLNNHDDKAEQFRELCLEEAKLINNEMQKLKRPEEIPDINYVRENDIKVEELDNSLKNLELDNTSLDE